MIVKTNSKFIPAIAAAFALAAAVPSSAASAEPDEQAVAAAKRLMATMEVQEQIAPTFEAVKTMQGNLLGQQGLTDEQKARAREILEASWVELSKAFEWSRLEPMLVRVYSSTFSTEEMDRLSDFFAGPDGKIFVERQAKLQSAMMAEMQNVMMEIMPKLQEATQEAIERVKVSPPNQ